MFSRIKNCIAVINSIFSASGTAIYYTPAAMRLLIKLGSYVPVFIFYCGKVYESIGAIGLLKTLEKMSNSLLDESDVITVPPKTNEEKRWRRKRAEKRNALKVLGISEDDCIALRNIKSNQHTS